MSFDRTSVSRSVTLNAPIDEVWAVAGDFHGLHKWHPAVTDSLREHVGDEEFRALTLADGGRLLEHLEDRTSHSYRYAILRGPLPVRHYHATLEATDAGGRTTVTWSSVFEPTTGNAEEVIAAVYEAGLGALEQHFGGA
jgi:uncharacterized protein YndB with AHSA1/START domain